MDMSPNSQLREVFIEVVSRPEAGVDEMLSELDDISVHSMCTEFDGETKRSAPTAAESSKSSADKLLFQVPKDMDVFQHSTLQVCSVIP